MAVFFRDITERKHAEEAFRTSARSFQTIFSLIPDPTMVTDLETGRIVDINEAAANWFGMNRAEVIGRTTEQVPFWTDPNDRDLVFKAVEDESVVRDRMVRLRTYAGETWEALISCSVLDRGGRKVILSRAHDITSIKRAEEERFLFERKLLHSQKLESLGVMAGGIAHDFNNLLMAVLGNLDLALMRISSAAVGRENVEQAVEAARKAAQLTNQMLAYTGQGAFIVRKLNVRELIDENIHLLKAAIAKSITLHISHESGTPVVEADPAQLQQVVMNLITNAAEAFGEPGGDITLTTGVIEADTAYLQRTRTDVVPPPGTFAYLDVADTGHGMDAQTLQWLFDPFFTTKAMGRGLGMAAILGIVRGHKCAILVDSEIGKGTSVRVLIPSAGERSSGTRDAAEPLGQSAHSSVSLGGTMLLVDDEEIIRRVSSEMLREMGFRVLTAGDGEEALRLFARESKNIECVVLDLSMPKMDGIAVLGALRKIRPEVKIILSSGFHEADVMSRTTVNGVAGFIQKPYTMTSSGHCSTRSSAGADHGTGDRMQDDRDRLVHFVRAWMIDPHGADEGQGSAPRVVSLKSTCSAASCA